MMRLGLVPSWSKETKGAGKCINARSESAAVKPSFRAAFEHRRCLVPAHGYYEWTVTQGWKQPWHFHRKGVGPMCFAGLWERWTPPGKQDVAAPTGAAAHVHAFFKFAPRLPMRYSLHQCIKPD